MAKEDSDLGFVTGFILGGVLGVIIGILIAPKASEDVQALVQERGAELRRQAEASVAQVRDRVEELATLARSRAEELAAQVRQHLDYQDGREKGAEEETS